MITFRGSVLKTGLNVSAPTTSGVIPLPSRTMEERSISMGSQFYQCREMNRSRQAVIRAVKPNEKPLESLWIDSRGA